MRTFVKVLLFVFWLIGAGSGLSIQDSEPLDSRDVYYYTVMDGVDLSLHGDRVALHIRGEFVSGGVSLSATVPPWAAALSDPPERALTAFTPASGEEATTDSETRRSLPQHP